MSTPLRRRAIAALALALASVGVASAPASADPDIPLRFTVDATTTIAGLGQTVVLDGGAFAGVADLGDSTVTGELWLPPATSTVELLGLPLANATFAIQQTNVTTGTFDLATLQASITSEFVIKLTALRPTLLPFINLVRPTCQSGVITANLSGPINLTGPATWEGEFSIPPFRNCGLTTSIINLLIPGDGNTITAALTPTTV